MSQGEGIRPVLLHKSGPPRRQEHLHQRGRKACRGLRKMCREPEQLQPSFTNAQKYARYPLRQESQTFQRLEN